KCQVGLPVRAVQEGHLRHLTRDAAGRGFVCLRVSLSTILKAQRVNEVCRAVQYVGVAVKRLRVPPRSSQRIGREPAALGGGIAAEGRGLKDRRGLEDAEGG